MAKHPSARPGPYSPTRGKFVGETFSSFRQYQNARARTKGFPSWRQLLRAPRPVRTKAEHESLRPASRLTHGRALEALSLMRHRSLPIKRAAAEAGTTVEAILKYGGTALGRGARGGYSPRPVDRLFRQLRALTPSGSVSIEVRDSRSASLISRHANAIRRYLATGDAAPLREFRRKSVRSNKRGYRLLSDLDLDTIDQFARAGEISYEDLYDFAA
jgi:hypothetical protein